MQQTHASSNTQNTRPPAVVPQPTDAELPLELIAIAAAGGLVFCVLLLACVCCIVRRKRASGGGGGGGGARSDGSAVEMRGNYGTSGSIQSDVAYGSLPSDSDRIQAATGKAVVAVEWEQSSDEE
eukprot:TRINITY_DN1942_c0_g1_i1.p2 TRINITY_DN1942_c0_g1~~TRINITY_DN1942_c0_g1_i1.p2  ORF type:complete len:125 (-),score=56.03 TRINITY_DN1942_c0_g1_i1:110-484(-)